MRKLFAAAFLLLGLASAHATEVLTGSAPAYNGSTSAIAATGFSMTSGELFAAANSSLNFPAPFTLAYWIKTNSLVSSTNLYVIDSTAGNTASSPVLGYWSGVSSAVNQTFWVGGHLGGNSKSGTCNFAGAACARATLINDNNWHHICYTVTAISPQSILSGGLGAVSSLYIDGFRWDQVTTGNFPYNPVGSYLSVGSATSFSGNLRDMRIYSRQLSALECGQLYSIGKAGNVPTGAPYTTNLVAYWPMGNCTGSGCPDSTSNHNDLFFDTAPTVAITNPTNGATGLSGTVNLQSTCTDAIQCVSVSYTVDSTAVGTATTAPYTIAWDTTKFIDGAHTIVATGTNAVGATSTNTITASTSNSITSKTVYMDPTSATDCPTHTGLSTGSPCSTWAGVMTIIASNPLLGGDSVLQKAGTNLNLATIDHTTALILCGAGSSGTGGCSTQNTFPGAGITIGTYGGTGQCTVLAGTTTDCGKTTWTSPTTTSGTPYNLGMITLVNVSNVTVQNMRLDGGSTVVSPCGTYGANGCPTGVSVIHSTGSGGVTANNTVTNVETINFPFAMINSAGPYYANGGTGGNNYNNTFSDNYVHTTSTTSLAGVGIYQQHVEFTGSTLGASYISNYVTGQGGTTGSGQEVGSGMELLGISRNILDEFNVTTAQSANGVACGDGYAHWWYTTTINAGAANNIVKGNESANVFPTTFGGCDKGTFDMDIGVQNFNMSFNYAHETYGPCNNVISGSALGIAFGSNTLAYNIFENCFSSSTGQDAGLISGGSQVGFFDIYNNTVWNGYNGLATIPNNGGTVSVAAVQYVNCPAGQSVWANNIFVVNGANARSPEMYQGETVPVASCSNLSIVNNDWFPTAGTPYWRNVTAIFQTVSGLSNWVSLSGSTLDQQTNPNFAGSGGGATACYTPLSGVPVQPGSIPCPSAYELNNSGNTFIGTGTDITAAPYNKTLVFSFDYFTNAVPNGTGTGWNIGADGGHH
jgi:hypothetical protein